MYLDKPVGEVEEKNLRFDVALDNPAFSREMLSS